VVELLPAIAKCSIHLGWKPGELDEVYISAGPGSFTGLRIAITVAKTLALACGVRLVAVPSLAVIAANAPHAAANVGVVLDAKREQVFAGLFERQTSGLVSMLDACLIDPRRFVSRSPKPLLLLGEGLRYHPEGLSSPGVELAEESLWWPNAEVVFKLGRELAKAGQFADPAGMTPIYLRVPEAEELWSKRQVTNCDKDSNMQVRKCSNAGP